LQKDKKMNIFENIDDIYIQYKAESLVINSVGQTPYEIKYVKEQAPMGRNQIHYQSLK
jgi:spore coat polysaccharide biosynthesis predicted glycosyltransferase SpsG